jgi:hypothetical protein
VTPWLLCSANESLAEGEAGALHLRTKEQRDPLLMEFKKTLTKMFHY